MHLASRLAACALALLTACSGDPPGDDGGAGGGDDERVDDSRVELLPEESRGKEEHEVHALPHELPTQPANHDGVLYAAPGVFEVTNYSDAVPAPAGSLRAALQAAALAPLVGGFPHKIEFITSAPGTIKPVAPYTIGRKVHVRGNNKVTIDSSTAVSNAIVGHTLFEVPSNTTLMLERMAVLGRLQQRGVYVAKDAHFNATLTRIANFGDPADHVPDTGGCVLCDGWEAVLGSSCSITTSTVQGCTADWGGAFAGIGRASLLFSNSDVSFNISAQQGGGVFLLGSGEDHSSLAITRTSMRTNTTWTDGGAVRVIGAGYVNLHASTLSNNSSYVAGGASVMLTHTELRMRGTTIAPGLSTGGSALTAEDTWGFVSNSLFFKADSASAPLCSLDAATTISFGNSIIRDASCGPPATLNTGMLPMITTPCGIYAPPGVGGCKVHPIEKSSPARGAGNPFDCAASTGNEYDQRRYTRGAVCDIGAYEWDGVP